MKKLISLLLVVLLAFAVVGCSKEGSQDEASNEDAAEVITIGVSPEPHGKIVELIKDDLEKEGIQIEIVEFTDYVTPNRALADGDLDANFFQHEPYLKDFIEENNLDLISIGAVHLEPMGLYSTKYKSIDEIEDGAEIAIPNDATNGGRALLLLEKAGLIKLDDDAGILATEKDIVDNPKNLKFTPLEAAQLPRVLNDLDGAVINGNFALEAGLIPTKDAILLEDKDSPYANIVAVRSEEKDEEKFKKLMKALQSDEVKQFIEENYEGGVIPAF
ncbi:MAG: MetQ/NlpA family ABC transporter substrate-binding protein [Tissierellia bacterium]|nr:MetQ/NlpA family ABC transporter substrate-binding protein [Tissierellia bacterium]